MATANTACRRGATARGTVQFRPFLLVILLIPRILPLPPNAAICQHQRWSLSFLTDAFVTAGVTFVTLAEGAPDAFVLTSSVTGTQARSDDGHRQGAVDA